MKHKRARGKRFLLQILIVPILCLVGTSAQQNPSPSLAIIEGVVLDSATGEPIPNVDVFRLGGEPRTSTDERGRFRLQGWALGDHFIYAGKDGSQTSLRFSITEGEHLSNVVFHLTLSGVISGAILDANGSPVVYALPRLLQPRYSPFSSTPEPILQAVKGGIQTDDKGTFRMVSAPGRYLLFAQPRRSLAGEVGVPLSGALYPGVNDPTKASEIIVKPGQETRLSPMVLRPATGRIHVHVRDESTPSQNNATGQGRIRINYFQGRDRFPANLEGTYVIGSDSSVDIWPALLGPGLLLANLSGSVVQGFRSFNFTGTDQNVEVVLARPDGMIGGKVTAEFAPNLPSLATFKIMFRNDYSSATLTIKADGSFENTSLTRGSYRLDTRPFSPSCYVLRAQQGDKNLLRDEIEITNQRSPAITITLSCLPGGVHGFARDQSGKVIQDALILLVPLGSLAERTDTYTTFQTVRSNQKGEFRFRGVIPGDYLSYAWGPDELAGTFHEITDPLSPFYSFGSSAIEDGAFRDPLYMEKFQDRAVRLRVEPGQDQSLQVNLRGR